MIDIEEHINIQRIRRALEMEGGLYEFEDILDAINNGHMQSFSDGDSLVVTRISHFPRKKVLEIIIALGTIEQLMAIEPRLVDFAKEWGCSAMMAYGRLGWEGVMTKGWKRVFSFYMRDLK